MKRVDNMNMIVWPVADVDLHSMVIHASSVRATEVQALCV